MKTRVKKKPAVVKAQFVKAAVAASQRLKAKETRKTQIEAARAPRPFTYDLWDNEGLYTMNPKILSRVPNETWKNRESSFQSAGCQLKPFKPFFLTIKPFKPF